MQDICSHHTLEYFWEKCIAHINMAIVYAVLNDYDR